MKLYLITYFFRVPAMQQTAQDSQQASSATSVSLPASFRRSSFHREPRRSGSSARSAADSRACTQGTA